MDTNTLLIIVVVIFFSADLVGSGEGGGTEETARSKHRLLSSSGRASLIREHPKRTSTMKRIPDIALVVSIILVDPKMAGSEL